jgi:hypothetical protein
MDLKSLSFERGFARQAPRAAPHPLPCVSTEVQGNLEERKTVAGATMTNDHTPTAGASTSSVQPKFEGPKTSRGRSLIWRWVSWPLKIIFLVIRRLFLFFAYLFVAGGVAALVATSVRDNDSFGYI